MQLNEKKIQSKTVYAEERIFKRRKNVIVIGWRGGLFHTQNIELVSCGDNENIVNLREEFIRSAEYEKKKILIK